METDPRLLVVARHPRCVRHKHEYLQYPQSKSPLQDNLDARHPKYALPD